MSRDHSVLLRNARSLVYDGNVNDAQEIIASIRAHSNIHFDPLISGEVQIVEGLILAASARWNLAIDKFKRGSLLGQMRTGSDVSDFADIWLAHCQLKTGSVLDALDSALRIVGRVGLGRIEHRHRFSVVLAEIHVYIGERQLATEWFEVSRALSGEIASRGLFSATLFNMCALRVWQSALLPRLHGRVNLDELRSDLLFLESSINYDLISGVSNRGYLHNILRGQLLGLLGKIDEALSVYDILLTLRQQIGDYEFARVRLEVVWCKLQVGGSRIDSGAMRGLIGEAIEILRDDDDLAFAYFLLGKLDGLVGDLDSQRASERTVSILLDGLQCDQKEVRRRLSASGIKGPASVFPG